MAIRKKAAAGAVQTEGKLPKVLRVEVVHVKTYVCPNGDAYYAGKSYVVTPEKRTELFKYKDEAGVPYFRDYDAARYKKPVKETPENLNEEQGSAVQGPDAAGEIDTGVVRLPKGMRRTSGVTV